MKVGITGIFGSGKTTVSSIFKDADIPVVSCDDIVQRLLKKREIITKITDIFSKDAVREGSIDKKYLSDMVFSDKKARIKLEQILHPEVFKTIQKKSLDYEKIYGIMVIEIPLLFETKSERLVDKVVVVKASRRAILERLKERYTEKEILQRWKSQIPLKDKEKKADYVIDNSGTYSETFRQVQNLIEDLETIVKQ
ncbi:MAG: dephospho-CoA kinase [Elusimicrobia bacterium]|nr:dephospho-CoA kinase [Elusimicrobiota bacterium]